MNFCIRLIYHTIIQIIFPKNHSIQHSKTRTTHFIQIRSKCILFVNLLVFSKDQNYLFVLEKIKKALPSGIGFFAFFISIFDNLFGLAEVFLIRGSSNAFKLSTIKPNVNESLKNGWRLFSSVLSGNVFIIVCILWMIIFTLIVVFFDAFF